MIGSPNVGAAPFNTSGCPQGLNDFESGSLCPAPIPKMEKSSSHWLQRMVLWSAVASLLFVSSGRLDAQDELPTALSGIESSERFDVVDHQPWQPQSDYLLRLLYRVGHVSEQSLKRFESPQEGSFWHDLGEQAQTYRFRVVRVVGRARYVVPVRLDESVGVDFKGYYRVQVTTESGATVWLACRAVPRTWPLNEPLDEPIVARGFFLAFYRMPDDADGGAPGAPDTGSSVPEVEPSSGASTESGVPVVVVRRPAWFPDRVDASKGVTASHVWLAGRGVDIGQFDRIRRRFNHPLGRDDAASMFQLLVAARQADPFPRSETISMFDLLQQPTRHVGQAVRIEGHVRRVIRIDVESDPQAKRLGLDHYYELDLFVPLADRRIVIKHRPVDEPQSEPIEIVYEDRFPITVCVVDLPAPPEAIRGRRVKVDGFLFRFWSYESTFTARVHPAAGQISPLVVGAMPMIDEASRLTIDWILGSAIAGVALGLIALFWYARRDDRIVTNPVLIRNDVLPDQWERFDSIDDDLPPRDDSPQLP